MLSSDAKATCHRATATAPGKLLLIGEHAAVYGQPAFALPFPAVSATATVTPTSGALQLISEPFTGCLTPIADLPRCAEGFAHALSALLAQLQLPAAGLDISLVSTIPLGAGLGSSAATAAALLRAVLRAYHAPEDPTALEAWVHVAERVPHGRPSGVDGCVVVAQKPLCFTVGSDYKPVETGGHFILVVANSGIPRETGQSVARVAEFYASDSAAANAAISSLGELAILAMAAWKNGEARELGRCLDNAHSQLELLGVSSLGLNRLVAAAREAGALGAKLTGAGLGGCVLALAESDQAATQIAAAFKAAGALATWQHTYHPESA
jgi:mevalonate kinase